MLKKIVKILCFFVIIIGFGLIIKNYADQKHLFNDLQIKIRGNVFIKKEQLLEYVNPHIDESLLSLDLKYIQNNLALMDYIETTQLSQILPNTLVIDVVEKQPILLIIKENSNYFMDKNGFLISTNNNSLNFFPVPMVTTINEDTQLDDIHIILSELFKYIFTDYPIFYENLSEISIDNDKWIFHCDNKTKIYATTNNLYYQINKLKKFEETIFPNKHIDDYQYIDLRITEQVIAKEKYKKG